MTRTILLHYHLFKNAGTSVDHILKANFGDRWVTREFSTETRDNSAQVAAWIESTPDAVAFSTHTAVGPIPDVPGVRVLSVMMLRDPVARIRSAYRFEVTQQSDSWGAQLAKDHDLEGYVEARLARNGDRQCRNFQTTRLAMMVPGRGGERARALAALRRLTVVGLVEDFEGTLRRLEAALRPWFPEFHADSVRANTTGTRPETDADARVNARLEEVNRDDLAILDAARILIARQVARSQAAGI